MGPQQGSGGEEKKKRERLGELGKGDFSSLEDRAACRERVQAHRPPNRRGCCAAHDWRPPPGPSRFPVQSPAATITAAAACWRAPPARVTALRAPCTSPAAAARESESEAAPAPGIAQALCSEGGARPVSTPGLCAPRGRRLNLHREGTGAAGPRGFGRLLRSLGGGSFQLAFRSPAWP